ncbi:DNA or RNA helicase [Pseudohongiella nitratireducens]|uniref:DNA or RNA helicase n=1 Tax=Pseudohongiella nitratireducens TaxID=1768907 RepID=A0A917GTI8_9GAMM|nr:AAA family ATPase [Pseudohongiella nitratireducens]GGG55974.1 DNA or RNA helicase [Pseudohongiella nitratireducens]
MINIRGINEKSSEYKAAKKLANLALDAIPYLDDEPQLVLEIYVSPQCFGQAKRDVDLLVVFANYSKSRIKSKRFGHTIHSFCAAVEVKDHSPDQVRFDGNRCIVKYRGEDHDATEQSEGQRYAVMSYIKKHNKNKSSPWITNLIWFQNVPCSVVPKSNNNILGCDITWDDLMDKTAMLTARSAEKDVACFSSRRYLNSTTAVFSKVIETSNIDRKRLETITRSVLDRSQQQYAEKLGKQLLIFRGRGGTGKTVRLIRLAYQAYDELGLRVVLLTYNKALVTDLHRLLVLLGVRNSFGEGGIAIKTIHSFVHEWLVALNLMQKNEPNFFDKYERLKDSALEFINTDTLFGSDIEEARARNSANLTWDLVLIDESQDWPGNERDLLYALYGAHRVIIADGVDQFVRGVEKIDWRLGIDSEKTQIVPLRKSLRLKSSLCQTVGHFAEEIEYGDWNLKPLPESYGGRVLVITGDPLSQTFHKRLAATLRADGNQPIDMLLCVPPSWVKPKDDSGGKQSIVAKHYLEWGWECWDGTDPDERDEFPTSAQQYRIVQYESCRGLEGWIVVNFALDEFFEYKKETAEFSEAEEADMFFETESAALEYAKKWLMIPLTRAIDTLVIHISDSDSYIGKVAKELQRSHPENIEFHHF